MEAIRFVEVEEALRIHARQIKRFGGDPGVRDLGLLESALAMPRASFGGAYVHHDVVAMAGAYLFHLAKNHAFVDGNKRVALAVALFFLARNGRPLDAEDASLHNHVLAVASGSMGKERVTAYLREQLGVE
ncbi:MAG: type II toxin-antitoxin system death-on-curing family toxin [Planctomycetota bacterium]